MDALKYTHPDFDGFGKTYRDEILPSLIAHDMERRNLAAKFKRLVFIAAALGLCVGLAIGFKINAWGGVVFGAIIFAAISGVGYAGLSKLKNTVKHVIMGKVCAHLRWTFAEDGFEPIPLSLFLDNGLLSKSDRQTYEDQMSGLAHGAKFIMNEAHLQRKRRDSDGRTQWTTVFRGVLMRLEFPRKFLGTTIVARDAGWFNFKKKKGLKRVGLVDPVFEKIFEAYGSDQVEARYLLTPTFMQRLVDMETLLSGKKLRAGFVGGELLIVVEAPDQFEAGSMFTPLTEIARTQKIIDEIGTVLDIVDIVNQR